MPKTKTIPWQTVRVRLGRNDLIGALVDNYGDLDPNDLPMAVRDSWSAAEWPERLADTDVWLTLFDRVGYIVDGVPVEDRDADLGGDLITLYRGAIPEHRAGLAWTRSLKTATWFAHRFDGIRQDKGGKVWQITIPTDFVLARMSERGEDEVIVDTSDFDDEEYTEVQGA